jgi:hypothetical protein
MEHRIEAVGREMRRMMPFLDAKEVMPGLRGAQSPASTSAKPAAKGKTADAAMTGAAR